MIISYSYRNIQIFHFIFIITIIKDSKVHESVNVKKV